MARRSNRSRSGRRSPGLVGIAALMSSVAFMVAVLSKVWPLKPACQQAGPEEKGIVQHDIASRREICCLSTRDKLKLAAESIDP